MKFFILCVNVLTICIISALLIHQNTLVIIYVTFWNIKMGLIFSKQSQIQPQMIISYQELLNLMHPEMYISLSPNAHQQMYQMWLHSYVDFKNMVEHIVQQKLAMRPYHFNRMVDLIFMESQIDDPAFHERVIQAFHELDYNESAVEEKLRGLYQILNLEIQNQAQANHLLHHGVPHAYEVQNRFELNMSRFELLSSHDLFTRLMRQVVLFFVKNHDLIQIKIADYLTVEEHTAKICKERIFELLQIEETNPLAFCIEYVSQMIIVLGTTLIWGEGNFVHMDFSHLYLMFKKLSPTKETQHLPAKMKTWRDDMESLMILISICDKYPALLTHSTMIQANQESMGSFRNVANFLRRPLDLQRLFKATQFSTVFHSRKSSDYYFQAFMIAIVPHIAMQLEFYAKNKFMEAHRFYSFIDIARENSLNGRENFQRFHQDIIDSQIPEIFDDFFIKKMEKEIQFCTTLRADFSFFKGYFKLHYPQLLNAFDEEILENNIRFLNVLMNFFSSAKYEDKIRVIEELLMNMVMQQGFLITKTQKFSEGSERTLISRHPFSLYTPKRHSSVVSVESTTVCLK